MIRFPFFIQSHTYYVLNNWACIETGIESIVVITVAAAAASASVISFGVAIVYTFFV